MFNKATGWCVLVMVVLGGSAWLGGYVAKRRGERRDVEAELRGFEEGLVARHSTDEVQEPS